MNENWSKDELKASVEAYVEMQRKVRAGLSFVKKLYYEQLAEKYGRTSKAFEYRMQNISYVLSLMGRDWLSGLKPAKNVGAKNAAEIESLISTIEGRKAPEVAAFEIKVREVGKQRHLQKPNGNLIPKASSVVITQFQRDPFVKAWILKQALGKCECCKTPAPFSGADGLPFLEVHHVRQLADDGSDTVSNAVALCPNCHRELHYGINAPSLVVNLYDTITRLVRE